MNEESQVQVNKQNRCPTNNVRVMAKLNYKISKYCTNYG